MNILLLITSVVSVVLTVSVTIFLRRQYSNAIKTANLALENIIKNLKKSQTMQAEKEDKNHVNNKHSSAFSNPDSNSKVEQPMSSLDDWLPSSFQYRYKNSHELYKALIDQVIGQDEACRNVCAHLYKHILYLHNHRLTGKLLDKSNFLLMGSTGTGKTHIVKSACDLAGFSFIEVNAKSICQEGWHGRSLEELLLSELKKIPNILLERTVVLIDEFDKICMPLQSSSNENVNRNIQYGLLKILEGCMIGRIGGEYHTAGLCFILAGNFQEIRDKRQSKSIGYVNEGLKRNTNVITKELLEFGAVPELVGRLGVIQELRELTKEDYTRLWDTTLNFDQTWRSIFSILDICYHETEKERNEAIEEAMVSDIGVRSLLKAKHKILNRLLDEQAEKIDVNMLKDTFGNI